MDLCFMQDESHEGSYEDKGWRENETKVGIAAMKGERK